MKLNLLAILLIIIGFCSCSSRYWFRDKVNVTQSSLAISQNEAPKVDSSLEVKTTEPEEAFSEVTSHQVSSGNMIDTTIDRIDESVDIKKNSVLQKEQPDLVSIEKQHKQTTNTSRNSVQTAFWVSGIILAVAMLMAGIGAISMSDPNYPPEAGISPFIIFAFLLVFVFMVAFIAAIIILVVHEMKNHPTPEENK